VHQGKLSRSEDSGVQAPLPEKSRNESQRDDRLRRRFICRNEPIDLFLAAREIGVILDAQPPLQVGARPLYFDQSANTWLFLPAGGLPWQHLAAASMLEDLTEAERRLCEAFSQANLPAHPLASSSPDDRGGGRARDPDTAVRAEVIQSLLLQDAPRSATSLRVAGMQVVGVLDLAYARVTCQVSFEHCSFTETPDLHGAELRGISFDYSHLPALRMDDATVNGNLSLMSSTVDGEISASAVKVKGSLILSGARVGCSSTPALQAARLSVDGDLRMDDGFTATGAIVLVDAHIAGFLSLAGAVLQNKCKVALEASRLLVDGPVFCGKNFTVQGAVVFRRARIGGFLDLADARLSNLGDDALLADHLSVASIWCPNAIIHGGVTLMDAHVRGPLNLSGTQLHNSGSASFTGSRLVVDGPVFCRENFAAEGTFVLRRARIGGFLDFTDSHLSNPDGDAFFAPAISVEGGLSCTRTKFDGGIRLTQSKIPGSLDLSGADINTHSKIALDCARVTTPRLCLPKKSTEGAFDLSYAQLQVLDAPPQSSRGGVQTSGLTYETLEPLLDAEQRILWLDAGTGYTPQPFEQLASAYRRIGHDADARKVLLAKQRRRRRSLPVGSRLWGLIQDLTTGYGYRPGLAAGWLTGLLILGTTIFSVEPPAPKGDTSHFNPFFYTLDLLLPILTYGQESSFTPKGGYQWFAYTLVTAGWVLATALISGITRVLSRS
jgi:hypothetical protein